MTWRELVYMINDELKLDSDDSSFNEEHIAFLAGKYRALILEQKYSGLKNFKQKKSSMSFHSPSFSFNYSSEEGAWQIYLLHSLSKI